MFCLVKVKIENVVLAIVKGIIMGHYYSYRTQKMQDETGIKKQDKAFETYAVKKSIVYSYEIEGDNVEKSFEKRGSWQALEEMLEEGDTVVVYDLHSFSADDEDGFQKYVSLLLQGINIDFIRNEAISTEKIRNLLDVAEMQLVLTKDFLDGMLRVLYYGDKDRCKHEYISQRTKEGMAASANKAGRKTGHIDKMTQELRDDIIAYLGDRNVKAVDLIKKHGISRNTFKKYVKIVESQCTTIDGKRVE